MGGTLGRIVVVHSTPLSRVFRAPLGSSAACISILLFCALWILPFFIAFATPSFWIKEESYYERPDVHFRHEVVVELSGPATFLTWSSSKSFSSLVTGTKRAPAVKAREVDKDFDGLVDEFFLSLSMPMATGESVNHLYAAIFFQYNLKKRIKMQMEGALFIDESFPTSAPFLDIYGSMNLQQQEPLPVLSATRKVYNGSMLSDTSTSSDASISHLMMLNSQRNESILLHPKYSHWGPSGYNTQPHNPVLYDGSTATANPQTSSFTMSFLIAVPPQKVVYQPGFFETMKFGWVQYISVFWLVWGVIYVARYFVFDRYMVSVLVTQPTIHEHAF
ncbi:transmembrane protein 231-like [Pelomyxa schiedti]|nr:transmembrane protein 231-like [Pelomyxa schiedti]